MEIVGKQIIYQNNSFLRIKRWIKGKHPQLGVITLGLTGWETIQEIDIIKPKESFLVKEKDN